METLKGSLIKEINISLNSLDMYEKTKQEMIESSCNARQLETVELEIRSIKKKIKELTQQLVSNKDALVNSNMEVTIPNDTSISDAYYDNKNKNIWLSISNGDNFCLNTSVIPDTMTKKSSFTSFEEDKMVNEIKEPVIVSRFLCHLPEMFSCDPIMIDTVRNSLTNHEMEIIVREFIEKEPVIVPFLKNKNKFTIKIDILSPSNEVIYTETYGGCQIVNVDWANDLSYWNTAEQRKLSVKIKYDYFCYNETSSQEKHF
jgi:hypothetical protein